MLMRPVIAAGRAVPRRTRCRAWRAGSMPRPASRTEIEDAIEELISLLDRMDGDVDLEPEIDGGFEELGEASSNDGAEILPVRPIWGEDQTAEPVNYQAARTEWHARASGLVPNGRGGWRVPG